MKKNIISGIYCIENVLDGKKYIGYAKDIFRRWEKHRNELKLNNHDNGYLQNTYNKYSKDIFKYWIIQECSNENLPLMEIYWISYYNSYRDDGGGYNLTRGGDGLLDPSQSTRKKLSEMNKGENSYWYGKKHSEESNRKRSLALMGENNHNYGKPRPEETKKKISDKNKGRKHTKEELIRMSEAQKGKIRKISEETKKKISISKTGKGIGRKHSNISLQKMSDWQLGIKKKPDATSTYMGVSWKTQIKKWVAQIRIDGKNTHIGYFPTELEAALAYNEAAIEFYGWKAKLNNISKEEIEILWEMQIETQ